MSRYLTVATPRVTQTSVIYIECIIMYVEIILWTVGLARVFYKRAHHRRRIDSAWSSGCRGFSYMGWNIVYLQVERTKERVQSRRAYMHMDVIIYIELSDCIVYIFIWVCIYFTNNNTDTLVIEVTFYIIRILAVWTLESYLFLF